MKQNKESRACKIREMILELLSDGKIHTTKEMMDLAVEKGIILDKNTDIVYNILFHMKKKGLIASGPDKAQYVLGDISEFKDDKEKKEIMERAEAKGGEMKKVSILNLDKEKYSLLQPLPARYSKMFLTVKESGELKMNSALMNKIKERNIEIFISKDMRTIILNPSGECTHKFTKAGTAKNREIVCLLKKLKIKFPIMYAVEWNESIGAWEGALDVSSKT